jgi:hypothetical protein
MEAIAAHQLPLDLLVKPAFNLRNPSWTARLTPRAPSAMACPAALASSLTVAVVLDTGSLQTGAAACARVSVTAAAAGTNLDLMA